MNKDFASEPPRPPVESANALNQRCYDALADNWDRLPFADFLPAWILHAHPPSLGNHVLDIGSGTGRLANWLSENGYSVLCLDPSEEMVKRCRLRGLETIRGTIQQFTFSKPFDIVIAVLSLIHVPKSEINAQLTKIANGLTPGGLLVLALIEGKGEGIGEQRSPYPRFFAYYTQQEALQMTAKDFECIKERRVAGAISYLVFVLRKR